VSRGEKLLAIGIVAACLTVGLIRCYPYVDNINAKTSGGNDWLSYKTYAVNIVEEGLELPLLKTPYWIPGGFLYNYFVAAVFAIAGVNSTYVTVLQHGMLGLAAVLFFMWARHSVSPRFAQVYMVVTALFLLYAFRWWVITLLSENLAVVLYPVTLLLLTSAIERRSLARAAAAGFLAGAVILTRPNLLPWPFLLVPLLFWSGDRLHRRFAAVALFLGSAMAAFSLLAIRNYYVSHQWVASSHYGALLPRLTMVVVGKRLLFSAGVLVGGWSMTGSELVVDKKWLLLTLAAIAAFGYLAFTRRLRLIDMACVLTIAAAFGPFILMPDLGGYGFRFQHPYGPLLLLLVFRGAYEWTQRARPVSGGATA
jgi:hypothetical protein